MKPTPPIPMSVGRRWWYRLMAVFTMATIALFLAAPAYAGTGHPVHAVAGVTIPDYWITFVVGSGVPAAVAFLNKRYAKEWWDATACLLLSAVSGLLATWQVTDNGAWHWQNELVGAFVTFITAVVMHYGFLSHVGLTGDNGLIRQAVPTGLGPQKTVVEGDAAH